MRSHKVTNLVFCPHCHVLMAVKPGVTYYDTVEEQRINEERIRDRVNNHKCNGEEDDLFASGSI